MSSYVAYHFLHVSSHFACVFPLIVKWLPSHSLHVWLPRHSFMWLPSHSLHVPSHNCMCLPTIACGFPLCMWLPTLHVSSHFACVFPLIIACGFPLLHVPSHYCMWLPTLHVSSHYCMCLPTIACVFPPLLHVSSHYCMWLPTLHVSSHFACGFPLLHVPSHYCMCLPTIACGFPLIVLHVWSPEWSPNVIFF